MTELVKMRYETPEIVILTLNRPEKRNALNIAMMEQLLGCFEKVEANLTARVVLINGEGPLFCSGLDLDEALDQSVALSSTAKISSSIMRFHSSRLITIALAHGAAIAGGGGIVAACDFALGTPEMKFAFPEVKRGLVPAIISPLLSPQLSWRAVRELLLLGRAINGTKAVEMGLLNDVVPSSQLFEEGMKLAREILEGGPQAIEMTKQLLNRLDSSNLQKEVTSAHQVHLKVRTSLEATEGIRAFREGRNPEWKPR